MFDSILLLPNEARKHPLDIGNLAEKMLYYKNVHLIAGKDDLITLFQYFDIDLLIEYIKSGYLKISVRKKHFASAFQAGTFIADFVYDVNYDLKKILKEAYFEFSGDEEKSKKAANKLYKYVGIHDTPSRFAEEIGKDLADQSFVKQAIARNFEYYQPNTPFNPNEIEFIVESQKDGRLIIESNLDATQYPFLETRSLLLNIGTAIEDVNIAANYNSEISIPELNAKIASAKVNSLIGKTERSENEIEVFQHSEFTSAPALQEVINQKQRSMEEYLYVLREATKFKSWLNDLGDDSKLIKEYTTKVNEKSWMQSIGSKSIRFYIVQGASTILKATGTLGGILAGLGLSAANTFLAEKLFKGWRPNQFIEGELKPFIAADET